MSQLSVIKPITITDAMLTSTDVTEADYSAYNAATAYNVGDRVIVVSTDVHKIYESLIGSNSSTVTMTIASPCEVTFTSHGLAADTPIYFTTTGALPTGIVANTVYYVKSPTASTFNIAATVGGAAINTSGTQSGTHTCKGGNINKTPASWPTVWLEVGATNRWKIFDTSNTSRTAKATSFTYTLTPNIAVSGIGALNITGATSIRVRMVDPLYGSVYDTTTDLTVLPPLSDWWNWLFGTRSNQQNAIFIDFPYYPFAAITIDFTGDSSLAVGVLILGQLTNFGLGINYGANLSSQDYSRKETNTFGDTVFVERAFAKRGSFNISLNSYEVDAVHAFVSSVRATPCLWIGSISYQSTYIYGWYQDFSILIAYPDMSECSLTLQGLT